MELKFNDQYWYVPTVLSTGNYLQPVCSITEGTGATQRVGSQITVKSIHLRYIPGLVTWDEVPSLDAPGSDLVRVIVFHDKQCNGAAAGYTDVLQEASIVSFNNLFNKDRFRILHDRVTEVNREVGFAEKDGANFHGSELHKFEKASYDCNIPLRYKDSSGGVSSLTSGSIGIMCISENGLATLQTRIRVRYKDF